MFKSKPSIKDSRRVEVEPRLGWDIFGEYIKIHLKGEIWTNVELLKQGYISTFLCTRVGICMSDWGSVCERRTSWCTREMDEGSIAITPPPSSWCSRVGALINHLGAIRVRGNELDAFPRYKKVRAGIGLVKLPLLMMQPK